MFTQKIRFDDITNLEVYVWAPVEEKHTKGVIQIVHGMAEYMPRYDEFANFLANNGYIVIGCDLYAHGKSVEEVERIGVVTRYDFMMAIIQSVKKVYDEMVCRFQDLPHYLFAHSMGSMAAQRYIEIYPDDFTKVILSGTDYPGTKYSLLKTLTKLFLNKNYVKYSKFIDKLGAGGFNKHFKEEHPKYAWLSRNLNTAIKYENDIYCGSMFPVDYYYSLANMMNTVKKKENLLKINPGILIQIMSGYQDPVGGFGKGPTKLRNLYNKNGIAAISILYSGARHECINELPGVKEKFFNDTLKFYNN